VVIYKELLFAGDNSMVFHMVLSFVKLDAKKLHTPSGINRPLCKECNKIAK